MITNDSIPIMENISPNPGDFVVTGLSGNVVLKADTVVITGVEGGKEVSTGFIVVGTVVGFVVRVVLGMAISVVRSTLFVALPPTISSIMIVVLVEVSV